MEDLHGKVAVITGGGSGIGFAIARAFAAEGGHVVLADIDDDALAQAETTLVASGAEVLTVHTDVSVLSDVEALAAVAQERFGHIDLVVNNAGVIAWNSVNRLTIADWRWVIGVNLWGVVHGVHTFLPIFEAQGTPAHFVNVSSVGGVLAETPFMATYGATKSAVVGLSLALDSELRMGGSVIGVSILCPSNTASTFVLDAERNRPADAPATARAPGVDQLIAAVRDVVDHGQPVDVLAARVLDAVKANRLWVFPHPDSQEMIQARLDLLGAVVAEAGTQTING
jgi:NAD(P)-dependent dehydrogenase (short-subunit alcohol dehydrogenase family)